MSKTSRIERRYPAGNVLTRIASALKRLCVAYLTWRTEQAMIEFLRSMSDRDLNDIGLSRSDIPGAVQRIWVRDGAIYEDANQDERMAAAYARADYAQSY